MIRNVVISTKICFFDLIRPIEHQNENWKCLGSTVHLYLNSYKINKVLNTKPPHKDDHITLENFDVLA